MAVRDIVIYPDKRLLEVCKPVGEDFAKLADLVRDMRDTMFSKDGAGLAAIQLGEPWRLFIIDPEVAGRAPEDPPLVCFDPEIIWLSEETQLGDEGCLSFPGIFLTIERALRCTVRARDLEGKTFEVVGEGLFARALQHETDHLNGRLITDFVGPLKRKLIRRRLEREAQAVD